MQFINGMYQAAQNYCQEIPNNLGKAVLYSFAGAFIVRSLVRNDPRAGAIAGALAASVAVIHALITPFFRNILGTQQLTWNEEMCRTGISLIATGYIAKAFGDSSIIQSLFLWAILYGLVNYLNAKRRDTNEAVDFFIYPAYPSAVPTTA